MGQQPLLTLSDNDIDILAQPKKFLVVVTAGGRTNAVPVLEIARVLSARGHVIEFATLEGQQIWTQDYPFISSVHILGPSQTMEAEEEAYLRMSRWKLGLHHSFAPVMETRKYLESSWAAVYPSLSGLVQDPARRPDFILADYLVDAVRDMKVEHDIPIAMHWPQMPTNMLPASYIPGAYGLQIEVLTSEHATLWQRLQNYLLGLRALPSYLRYRSWAREQRARLGIYRTLSTRSKPDHLLLVNSFFGLEPAKDLPPNVAAIGPVLGDTYPGLTPELQSFTANHRRILYISLGTHALLPDAALRRILHGATLALQSEQIIDGVIWSIRGMALKQFTLAATAPAQRCSISDLVAGANPHIYFCPFVPQRALLGHPNVSIFLTHAGASSTNEAVFHGIRTITIGVYFDQLSNAMKLRDAGVSILLHRDTFTPEELRRAVDELMSDVTGSFAANSDRLQRIARIASRRKYLAADLIEETLADAEGRKAAGDGRGMHLETADMRMPVWKARNWDLWVLGAGVLLFGLGVVVVVPVTVSVYS
ncbi:hypothetical protein AbraIFM66951_001783 [Aspergillus brasiliensis]|uniref:UDP-glycosyltransferases domain-containing protein n=1 Tax=Aspergillus brasiliensis TaxID=319629 RepID=A0A9W5Z0R8_9EURO|nr:hypothetical protein AbraCBS73388_003819 [Aspergillus brasiliensis]GKZ49377.1 hypothetical protein AbraIFM66951_001783 [Aspergillus brasiliensis]